MSKDYVQQAGMSKDVRVDGKRVAGKIRFNPPGSGGSRPEMAERDLEFIPEKVDIFFRIHVSYISTKTLLGSNLHILP